jgi:hypothetical protein
MTAGDEGDQGNGRLRVRVKQGKDDGSISGSVPGTALPLREKARGKNLERKYRVTH